MSTRMRRSQLPTRWTACARPRRRRRPTPVSSISIKDLFDIRGQVTRAGSRALDDSPPAEQDAATVARLRKAGFVVIGRTNMTEFAYSGIGINPHYGTPKGAWNRSVGHVPGGSSSGAAVSVLDGMAHGALGTDTGGSCRIPAAYQRHRRLQADAAARAARWLGAAVVLARQHRAAGAIGQLLCHSRRRAGERARHAVEATSDPGHAVGGADHDRARRPRCRRRRRPSSAR